MFSCIIFCVKNFRYSNYIYCLQEKVTKFTSLHAYFSVPKFFDTSVMYCQHALKVYLPLKTRFYFLPFLSAKIGSIPFFSSCGKHQSHHVVGFHATGINPLLIHILNALRCLSLLSQAIRLTWIIVSYHFHQS